MKKKYFLIEIDEVNCNLLDPPIEINNFDSDLLDIECDDEDCDDYEDEVNENLLDSLYEEIKKRNGECIFFMSEKNLINLRDKINKILQGLN